MWDDCRFPNFVCYIYKSVEKPKTFWSIILFRVKLELRNHFAFIYFFGEFFKRAHCTSIGPFHFSCSKSMEYILGVEYRLVEEHLNSHFHSMPTSYTRISIFWWLIINIRALPKKYCLDFGFIFIVMAFDAFAYHSVLSYHSIPLRNGFVDKGQFISLYISFWLDNPHSTLPNTQSLNGRSL